MRQGFYSPYFIVPKKGGGLRPILPFGLSLSSRVFTKVAEGALTPLREVGVRILNYLDDWLILAQSREQLSDHSDLVLRHLSQLGLRVNWEKSKLSPVQRISFLCVELDSVSMSQLARHLLLWSHMQFKSLRAVHIPGQLNHAADALSRQLTFPGEWRLHPETIRLIWSRFREAQVDLFASPESSHCQLYFSLTEGPLGTDTLAHSWPRTLRKYAFPPVSLFAQTLCKLREDEEKVLLVAPHWPTRTWFPELISLAIAPPWRIPLRKDLLSQGLGTIWHPRPDLWNLHVWLLDGTWQT